MVRFEQVKDLEVIMLISGLAQVNGFYDNIKLTDVEKKEDICSLFQAVANIIDDPDDHLYAYWWPCWRFRQEASADWYITLRDDYMICEQVNGCSSVRLSRIPYVEIESIGCDLFIDGSRLVGIWITLKNGIEIRLH